MGRPKDKLNAPKKPFIAWVVDQLASVKFAVTVVVVIAIACMARLQTRTLVLTTNVTAVKQWKQELLDKTTLTDADIGLYTGDTKEIRPVTIATYQILTYRKSKGAPFEHFKLFEAANWGLVIHDEVHMLPAPVFRAVAELQAKRRLGLTATLVREDGKEEDVFSLIGPKRVDVPWKTLEKSGFIATAHCLEIRVPLPSDERMDYAVADQRARFRIASENSLKLRVMDELLAGHPNDSVLVIEKRKLSPPESVVSGKDLIVYTKGAVMWPLNSTQLRQSRAMRIAGKIPGHKRVARAIKRGSSAWP